MQDALAETVARERGRTPHQAGAAGQQAADEGATARGGASARLARDLASDGDGLDGGDTSWVAGEIAGPPSGRRSLFTEADGGASWIEQFKWVSKREPLVSEVRSLPPVGPSVHPRSLLSA